MASRLNPYVSFDGDARPAMEFYRSVFGGSLTLSTYGELGNAYPDHPDRIMHSVLETPSGYTIMGADNQPGTEYQPGNTMTISLSGDDADELHGYWDKLADGGTIAVPMEKQAWGDEFGMCADRFGIDWMINISAPPA